jgi:asparagine synthase (glutamine-hydrolysing)
MCGITGIFDLKKAIQPEVFRGLNDLLTHRGPDDGRIWVSDDQQYSLGFRHLAIIDTSAQAMQPLKNEDGSIHLVCNGEIYNYQELKNLLIETGHVFSSTSDTEVIIHGYEEWGIKIFSRLNGMFAIAIMDQKTGKVILARDRFGIKPLYYQIHNNSVIFSSELRPVVQFNKPQLNRNSLVNFLIYRYIPVPETIYQNVFKLPPAHVMEIDSELKPKLSEYWLLEAAEKKSDSHSFAEQISAMLEQSVRDHLLSAVPIGAFLSGGYDSSYIALQMKNSGVNPMTFSMGFKDWENSEDVYAKEVAKYLNINITTDIIGQDIFLNDSIISAYDDPIADISIIPTFYVSKLAAQTHKVVLSGDGADEVLGGYNWYYEVSKQIQEQKKSFFRRPNHHQMAFEIYCRYSAMGLFDKEMLKETLHQDYHNAIPEDVFWLYKKNFNREIPVIKSLQLLDIKTFLPELILPKMDRASMANSLEVRPPFLDHRIAETIFKHDSSLYFDPDQYKKLLYHELKDKIPPHILSRKKQGFVGPDSFYNRHSFYQKLFSNSQLVEAGIINSTAINHFLKNNMPWHLWKLAVLELWFRKFEQ